MKQQRLDLELINRGLTTTRSQADSYIKIGVVFVNGQVAHKSGQIVDATDAIVLEVKEQYVSRAGLKLSSVAKLLGLNFDGKVVLDVGSSTGGFTDFSLRHGAKKVIAVDVGRDQLHPGLRNNQKIELHEQTDIRDLKSTSELVDIVLVDVSFISLRDILPYVGRLVGNGSWIVAMVKPQFEAQKSNLKHKGVIKNEKIRRQILKDFELWVRGDFVVLKKVDSDVAGSRATGSDFTY